MAILLNLVKSYVIATGVSVILLSSISSFCLHTKNMLYQYSNKLLYVFIVEMYIQRVGRKFSLLIILYVHLI